MKQALKREIERIINCKRHLIAAVVIPLFSLIFMATIFGDGRIENLPVGIVDCSDTPYSQEIIRTVAASPTLTITPDHIYSNEATAKKALQDMEIYGYIVIPNNFAENLLAGTTPTVTSVFHYSLLAVGGEIESAFAKSLGEFSSSLVTMQGDIAGAPNHKIESIILPTNGIFTSSYNTTLNYGTFLCYPFFFIFFQIFILTFTVYTIGTDLNKSWLESGKGYILYALAGKMLPYAIIFITYTLLANWLFFGTGLIPLQGNLFAITLISILFTISTMALGIAIISLIPKVAIAISIASMIGALGATASGVTFPIENMYAPFRVLCSLFPVRHFVLGFQSSLYNSASLAYSWHNYSYLLLTTSVFICATPLLKKAILKEKGKPLPYMWGASLVILGGTLGYGILYGLMYNPNIVTDVPIAVIDKSQTPQSRQFISNLNATQGVKVYAQCHNLPQAIELVKSNKVKGVVTLPSNFTARIIAGEEACFTVNETTTSFLYYLTIQKAIASTMQQMNNELRIGNVETLLLPQQLTLAQTPAINNNSIVIYNSNGGYGSYLLPVALILIIFQTMLMSGGILAGVGSISPLKFIPLLAGGYMLLSFLIIGIVPQLFNLPALANPWELGLFITLLIITTGTFIGALSPLLKDPEEIMLYAPFFSVGLIFLSGSSFPLVQIPIFWQIIHYIFPTSPGIIGYIKLNSMGGSLGNVTPEIITLIIQMLIYGGIFLITLRRINKKNNL